MMTLGSGPALEAELAQRGPLVGDAEIRDATDKESK
jgi:hypothetical protein